MADRSISMTPPPTPEQIEEAIELVRYLDPVRAHAVAADTVLSEHGIDDPACYAISLEIEWRFEVCLPDAETNDWTTVRDIAGTIARVAGRAA